MGNVLLIGGSPMIGKSTVAKRITSLYELQCISTDDIGEILQTVVDINPMKNMFYLDYYEKTELDVLINDTKEYHKIIEKAVSKIVDSHSKWGDSIVIEGYAIYPGFSVPENVEAVWLIAEEQLLIDRLNQSSSFANASDVAKDKYLKRSLWHNDYLLQQCQKNNRKYIKVDEIKTVDDIVQEINGLFSISF